MHILSRSLTEARSPYFWSHKLFAPVEQETNYGPGKMLRIDFVKKQKIGFVLA